MGVYDDNFPRGGQILKNVEKPDKVITLFGKSEIKNKFEKSKLSKKQRQKNAKTLKVLDKEITSKTAEALSYKTISEGMVILGCVHKVNEMAMEISLPGRLYGYVMITNISTPYTCALQKVVENSEEGKQNFKPLNKLFKPGQFVCTKVLSPDDINEHDVNLSLSPNETHSGINHVDVMKGSIHMVAVQSIEEHGYVIDIGISNCRAFLSKKGVPQEFGELGIGELIWCAVSKVTSTPVATTVNLTAMTDKLTRRVLSGDDIPLHRVTPGMNVEVTIDKVLSNGLQVKFLKDFIGYISDSYLEKGNNDVSNYSIGQTIQAMVLYVMPTSKLTYLTMRDLEAITPSDKVQIGDIVSGKVLARSAKGIYFKISKHARGFVTYKRIKTKPGVGSIDNNEIVRKYGKDSTHNIRVLSFDFMENVYICSNEPDVLKEKLLTLTDLVVGQIVTATIQSINAKGILVKVGKITGMITILHLSDIPIKNTSITSRYTVQQNVKARVLRINTDKQQLYLTMKPTLMDTNINILTSYDDVRKNKNYKGVVVQILTNGLVIAFFNDVKGFVPINQFNFENVKDPREIFFIGQVIDCTVLQCNKSDQRMTLSLKTSSGPSNELKTPILLGQRVSGVVREIGERHGLYVVVGNSECILPTMHLSQHRNLNAALLGTYNVGDTINDLVCVKSDVRLPILSLCEGRTIYGPTVDRIEEPNTKQIAEYPVIDLKDVKKGSLTKGWIHNISNKNLLLHCPFKDFKRFAVVPSFDVCDTTVEDLNELNLVKHQPLILKIMHVNPEKQNVQCSAKLSDVWDFSMQPSVDLLLSYLHDIRLLHEYCKISNNPLGNLSLGQRIEGVIVSLTEFNVILELPDKVEAVAQATNFSRAMKTGDKIVCVVLWLDFVHNCADVSIDTNIINKINENQDANKNSSIVEGSTVRCEILLIREEFKLGVFKSDCKQIAFLPTRRHINDFSRVNEDPLSQNVYKVSVITIDHGHPVCILKDQNTQKVKYMKELKQIYKRSRVDSTQDEQELLNKIRKNDKKSKLMISGTDSDTNLEMKTDNRKKDIQENTNISKRKQSEEYDITAENELQQKKKVKTNHNDVTKSQKEREQNEQSKFTVGNKPQLQPQQTKKVRTNDDIIKSQKKNVHNEESKITTEDEPQQTKKVITNKDVTKCKKKNVQNEESNITSKDEPQQKKKVTTINDVTKSKTKKVHNEESKITTEDEPQQTKKVRTNDDVTKCKKKSEQNEEFNITADDEPRHKKKVTTNNDVTKSKKKSVQNEESKITEEDKPRQKKKVTTNNDVTKSENKSEPNEESNITAEDEPQQTNKVRTNCNDVTKFQEKSERDQPKIETLSHINSNGLLDANSFFNSTADYLKQSTVDSSSGEESDSENEKFTKKKKLTTLERQDKMRKEEERLRQNELKLAEAYDNPQTADHFDRLLLSNPDNSMTWINYMAYHLQATEIEKARVVARKALSSISFREEQEKMNVWIALLNLENRYGTKETFTEVLEEAVRMNDERTMHMQAIQILAESSKIQDLTDMINKVLKKYKSSVDTWVNAGLACYKAGLVDKARQIMQKGLCGLENKQHIDLIVRFSGMENRFGYPERAQALIEQVLTSYPRRIDIWSQYIDMLVKSSQITIARQVLERAVTQKLPARKMKTMYKKFLDFESKYGDDNTVNKVRDMAAEYVKSAIN